MKLRHFAVFGGIFTVIICLLLFLFIVTSDDEESGSSSLDFSGLNLSAEVLKHQSTVEKYAKEYRISDYVNYLLAIMQVESGGTGTTDVMQASESLGLPLNSLSVEDSIKQGCKYFSELLKSAEAKDCDINTVVQSYNYGGGFIDYVSSHGKKYTFELTVSFAKDKSGGVKVTYKNDISIKENGGWRYKYGNMFYVKLVSQYLAVPSFSDATAQAIFNEALKYQGWKYVYGGSNPNTSFDCSGLVQWCYGKAGISLPRTAQAQYDATQHIPLSQAKAGDLVFFHSTYNAGTYVTHVGIYAGNNRMYHAGDPIGYADLTSSYWQQHLIGAGRVKTTAIDMHTVHEKEVIEQRIVDTNKIENFVKAFAKSYYSWSNTQESIEKRTAAINQYLTKSLQDLNVDTVRQDIPTSSTVTDVKIWEVEAAGTDDFTVVYSVDQTVTEGETSIGYTSAYMVVVHVDGDGNMVITQNPTIRSIPTKSSYEPKVKESDGTVDAATMEEVTEFLETFFKLYPTATEKELAYYVSGNVLEPVNCEYVFSELVNPIFTQDGEQVKVSVSVKYLDQRTKATQISQFDLTLEKDSNWKIVK